MKVSELVVTFLDGNVVAIKEGDFVDFTEIGFGEVNDLHMVFRDNNCMVNFLFTQGNSSKRSNYTYHMPTVDSIYHS